MTRTRQNSSHRKSSNGGVQKAAKIKLVLMRLADVQEHESNPRVHPPKGTPEWEALRASLVDCYFDPLIYNRRNMKLVGGAYRWKILQDLGYTHADMSEVDLSEEEHIARMIAANEAAGHNDDAKLLELLKGIQAGTIPSNLSGLTEDRLKELLAQCQPAPAGPDSSRLADRFGVPPFSVLDARQGYWQDRKRAWLALGIKSELGRGGNLLARSLFEHVSMCIADAPQAGPKKSPKYKTVKAFIDNYRKAGLSDDEIAAKALEKKNGKGATAKAFGTEGNIAGAQTGTSIFDPVLSELAYRWFCPRGGQILDPFAGGSVRGIVAAFLGRNYIGIDLRVDQCEANREQLEAMKRFKGSARWIVGNSARIDSDAGPILSGHEFDFIWTCPPYGDLERYSDNPLDLSTMDYDEFIAALELIVAKSVGRLKPDRFAGIVVGDFREKDKEGGVYHNFVSHTIGAFEKAGLRLYNEAVLVTACGTLPMRINKQFVGSRKLGKTHQNVLIFVKGDPKKATAAVGEVEFGEIEQPQADEAQL